ncbi:MAG: 2-phosphosulfolactate phosphatase, partial [Candidatus Latescibacteria bacterium]|nr:2-phosphosulfolactate phosphatase [Candidatus Latescibacterota bacterium]
MTYRCQLAKGRRGAREAAQRGDVIVVVDTLSFSTSAITAVHNGGIVFPCAKDEDPTAFAKRVNA